MITHLPTAHYPRFHLAFPVSDLGNALEFKAFGDINLLFAKNP
jgi:extradiol dioxygenase family protein